MDRALVLDLKVLPPRTAETVEATWVVLEAPLSVFGDVTVESGLRGPALQLLDVLLKGIGAIPSLDALARSWQEIEKLEVLSRAAQELGRNSFPWSVSEMRRVRDILIDGFSSDITLLAFAKVAREVTGVGLSPQQLAVLRSPLRVYELASLLPSLARATRDPAGGIIIQVSR